MSLIVACNSRTREKKDLPMSYQTEMVNKSSTTWTPPYTPEDLPSGEHETKEEEEEEKATH